MGYWLFNKIANELEEMFNELSILEIHRNPHVVEQIEHIKALIV